MARLHVILKGLLVLALSVAASAQVEDVKVTTEFCEQLVEDMSSCKRPKVDNTIKLDKYKGVWYEIGTNAQFAYAPYAQLGGQCVTQNYSTPRLVLGMNTFSVSSSFLKVIEDPQRAQVAVISDSARSITLNILSVCTSLVGSFLSVENFEAAVTRLGTGVIWTAANEKEFAATARDLRNQIASASERSKGMYDALAAIQHANNVLNGGGLPLNTNVAEARAKIQAQTAAIKSLLVVFNQQRVIAHKSAAALVELAFNPFTKAAAASVTALTGEMGAWFRAVQGISASVRAIDYTINALGTDKFDNLTDTFLNNTMEDPRTTAAKAASILGAMQLAAVNPTQARRPGTGRKLQVVEQLLADSFKVPSKTAATAKGQVVTVDGIARQSFFQAGRLQVAFSPLIFEDYLVLKAWGTAVNGYSTALIYNCMTNTGTGNVPQSGLVLLSRTPVVAPAVVATALAYAKMLGLDFGGDNPFVNTAQDPAFCGWN